MMKYHHTKPKRIVSKEGRAGAYLKIMVTTLQKKNLSSRTHAKMEEEESNDEHQEFRLQQWKDGTPFPWSLTLWNKLSMEDQRDRWPSNLGCNPKVLETGEKGSIRSTCRNTRADDLRSTKVDDPKVPISRRIFTVGFYNNGATWLQCTSTILYAILSLDLFAWIKMLMFLGCSSFATETWFFRRKYQTVESLVMAFPKTSWSFNAQCNSPGSRCCFGRSAKNRTICEQCDRAERAIPGISIVFTF